MYLNVILICISLIISDIQHILVYHWPYICSSPLETCLFRSSVYFLIRLLFGVLDFFLLVFVFVLISNFMSPLCILDVCVCVCSVMSNSF